MLIKELFCPNCLGRLRRDRQKYGCLKCGAVWEAYEDMLVASTASEYHFSDFINRQTKIDYDIRKAKTTKDLLEALPKQVKVNKQRFDANII